MAGEDPVENLAEVAVDVLGLPQHLADPVGEFHSHRRPIARHRLPLVLRNTGRHTRIDDGPVLADAEPVPGRQRLGLLDAVHHAGDGVADIPDCPPGGGYLRRPLVQQPRDAPSLPHGRPRRRARPAVGNRYAA
ncbi:hypothetical protein [Amycolatopsis sp. 3B14]|uniref:hypothetical protein n=1 Tax=Amycolatopsis sp. 3B14 TaxID=3243600 RepID=UPI003D96C6A8